MLTVASMENAASNLSLQDRFAPNSICFGCGPANEKGLKIKSYPDLTPGLPPGSTRAEFKPSPYQEAFPGMINGGIIGALLDCHSNWTATTALMNAQGLEQPPCTVTADFHVKLRAPTPSNQTIILRAHPVEMKADRVKIEATLSSGDQVTATCVGIFVAVKPGHPAFHRWG